MTAPLLGLTFDPTTHTYLWNGQVVPSVTQILERVGLVDFSGIPERIRTRALARGRRVHRAAELLTEGTLDPASVDERDQPYLDAAARFLADAEFRVLGQERRVFHAGLVYAGTTDILGVWRDQPAIADWCTGDTWEACKSLQLAGYAGALATAWPEEWLEYQPSTAIARVGVHLQKDGTYTASPYKDPLDFRKFQAAVTVAHEQLRRNKKGIRS